MFKRLICGGAGRHQVPKSEAHAESQRRAGQVAKLCVVAGAAIALPAAWPFLSVQLGGLLQAQFAPEQSDLVASDDGSLSESSPLPLPDDSERTSDDVPRFADDEIQQVSAIRDPLLGDEPVFSDEPVARHETPRFADDVVNAVITTSDLGEDSVLATSDVMNLVSRARVELAAGDVELAHRFAEAAAEKEIGIAYFKSRPLLVLDEIEFRSRTRRSDVRQVAVLSGDDVKNLVTRARLELAAGDLELAHRFAEAAAEVPIPVEYFRSRPQSVLDEIEFHQQLRNADFNVVEQPKPKLPMPSEPIEEVPARIAQPEPLPLAEETAAPAASAQPVVIATDDESFEKGLLDGLPLGDESTPASAVSVSSPESVPISDAPPAPPLPEPALDSERPIVAAEQPAVADEPTVPVIETTVAQQTPPPEAPAAEPVTPPKPLRPTERLAKTPRAYQALSQAKLNVRPKTRDAQDVPAKVPDSPARKQMAQSPTLRHDVGVGRNWGTLAYLWEAPGYYHSPLYFEEPGLERYGNEVPFVQPVLSAGSFLGNFATLPYQMATEGNGPIACQYDLRQERPGDCVPYSWQRLPLSATGALAEAGTALGLIYIIP